MTNRYPLGHKFYAMRFREKEVPPHCKVCGDSRQLIIPIDNVDYKVQCPVCEGKTEKVLVPYLVEYSVSAVRFRKEDIYYDFSSSTFPFCYENLTESSIWSMLKTGELSFSKRFVENQIKKLSMRGG